MARMSKMLRDLSVVLEGLEKDLFEDGLNKMYYNGLEFTRSDWHNLQQAVNHIIEVTERNNKTSREFLRNHKEYNRTLRMVCYYKSKPVKTERDFIRLEKLQRKLEKQLAKIEEERKINGKVKTLKKQIERERNKKDKERRIIKDDL